VGVTYVEAVNAAVKRVLKAHPATVVFGQNVGTGSCLSGLTRGIAQDAGVTVINTPNCENTLVGIGFGMMMGGVDSIFFMKQLDFLLLGVDQLVNTYNVIRLGAPKASFTICPVVIDNGYQGLQSSFNSLADLCAVARIDGFAVNSARDIEQIIGGRLVSPGFRIIGVSARLFGRPVIETSVVDDGEGRWVQYARGTDATIVCFNFALSQGLALARSMEAAGISTSIFGVTAQTIDDWTPLVAEATRTRRLVLLDDSKCVRRIGDGLLARLRDVDGGVQVVSIARDFSADWLKPQGDELEVDHAAVIDRLRVAAEWA
jgi:pyruvate/2-oxoglutarate/acetoin dehydrogenase E1 component